MEEPAKNEGFVREVENLKEWPPQRSMELNLIENITPWQHQRSPGHHKRHPGQPHMQSKRSRSTKKN